MISVEKKDLVEKWFKEYFTKGNLEILNELTTEDFLFFTPIMAITQKKK
ncbi:hypothetical protein SAMN05216353_10278 [Halobacillus alkaliphilus]|uniref:Uncharacterized protein n=1 Tax=Halobacillus alkaliphilus TaxID=396056 RepID=A0A1I2JXN5_9BACI|nr:hypothetical protein [Halobacillus alkaliphilus]SFF57526.1 hypothetical protein SAMN05216353_10278 [Halobacillus alkaliphilus]